MIIADENSLLEAVSDGIFLLDASGFVDCNEIGARMLGLTKDHVLGHSLADFSPEQQPDGRESAQILSTRMTAALAGEAQRFEWVLERFVGNLLDVEVSLNRMKRAKTFLLLAVVRDITEQKRALAALVASEKRYRTLFENAPVGIYRTTPDGQILAANPALVTMLGYSSFAEIIQRDLNAGDFEPEYTRSQFRERMAKERTVRGLECRWKRRDGCVLEVRENAQAVCDEFGDTLYYEGTVEDITELRKTEEALRASEKRYRDFITHSRDGVWRIELEQPIPLDLPVEEAVERLLRYGYFAECNEAMAQVAGVAHAQELVGKQFGSMAMFRDAGRMESYRSAIRQGWRSRSVEVDTSDQEGRFKCILRTEIPIIEQGNVVRIWGMTRDITELKLAEKKIKENEARFRTMFENAAIGIALVDLQGRTLQSNPALQMILGYTAEELGRLSFTEIAHPDDREQNWGLFRDLVAGNRDRCEIEQRYLRKDGRVVWGLLILSLVKDAQGQPQYAVGMLEDITHRKKSEVERQALREQLALAQKMESLGRLAGAVAHDFNNLLTIINGYSVLLQRQLREGDPMADSVREIHQAGERAAQLTRQLLAFSRKRIVEPTRVDLNALITEAAAMLQRLLGEHIEVATQLAPNLGMIMADSGNLHQILMNLAANAGDAMPGGGRFLIETANVELTGAEAAQHLDVNPGQHVRLTISDTGSGMDEDTRQRIFEPFFTTKDEGEGTGLGLAIVYGIVKQAGGSIAVRSEPGKGTRFVVHFPGLGDSDIASAAPPASAEAPRGTETVLLVEDQRQLRKLVARVLEGLGYTILEAGNAGEALLAVERHVGKIHLMLTDVVMPGITGKELVDRVKPLRPEMKVLYMSGYPGDVLTRRGLNDSGGVFIAKPFSPDALAAKVREVLGPVRGMATILVVDDEAGVRSFVRQVLMDAGYDVVSAANGREAMKIVRALTVHAVVTDLCMPEQDGIETIQVLRRDAPDIPVMAVSGAFDGQFLPVARALGVSAALTKPLNPDLLLTRLAEALAPKV